MRSSPLRRPTLPAVLGAIYGAASDPSRWPDALAAVADAVGGNGAMLTRHVPSGARGRLTTTMLLTARLRPDLGDLYMRHYGQNPYNTGLLRGPVGRAVSANDYVDLAAVRRSAFHADILAPQAIENLAVTVHPAFAEGGASGGFAVTLAARGADDMAGAVRRLDRLAPHLARALDLSLALAARADATRHLAAALDLMPGGALLLDAAARILHANPAAEALLRAGDGLRAEPGGLLRLSAALPAETAALDRGIARALSLAAGEGAAPGPPLRLSRPSGLPPLVLLVVGLPPAPFAAWTGAETARAIVLARDPAAPLPDGTAHLLRDAFGLTAAEAAVAALVAGGSGLPGAATTLAIAPSTAKTHLSRVFGKAGLRSQAELARLVGGLPGKPAGPPPPPAADDP